MRITVVIFLYLVSLSVLSIALKAQERDSIGAKEEVMLASELFQKSDEELRLMILKPRFRYINKADQLSLLKIGYRPGLRKYPNILKKWDGIAHNPMVSFERKIKLSSFSWNIETITRLHGLDLFGYDYRFRSSPKSSGRVGNDRLENGEFYTHRFRVHASVRYYYNLKSRIEAGVSGNNLAAEYFFFRIRDVLAYSEINQLEFTVDRQLSFHKRSKAWLIQPNYFSVGWGIQRPFFKNLLLDLNIEIRRKLHDFFDQDSAQIWRLMHINLFIGMGFQN